MKARRKTEYTLCINNGDIISRFTASILFATETYCQQEQQKRIANRSNLLTYLLTYLLHAAESFLRS